MNYSFHEFVSNSEMKIEEWLFGAFFVLLILTFISSLAYICYLYFKEGGASFLNNEKIFDDRYFEIRKKTNFHKNWFTVFPFNNVKATEVRHCNLFSPFTKTHRFKEFSRNLVHMISSQNQTIFTSLIYGMYDDLKVLNAELNRRLLQDRNQKIIFGSDEVNYDDQKDKVGNILANIPSKDALTENEIKQIEFLLYEIAINGILKDPKKLKKFEKILKEIGFRNPKDSISHQYIPVNSLEHLELIFGGLSDELQININLFDISYLGPENDIPKISLETVNPIREIDLLVEFKQYVVEVIKKENEINYYRNQTQIPQSNYPHPNRSPGHVNNPQQWNTSDYQRNSASHREMKSPYSSTNPNDNSQNPVVIRNYTKKLSLYLMTKPKLNGFNY